MEDFELEISKSDKVCLEGKPRRFWEFPAKRFNLQ